MKRQMFKAIPAAYITVEENNISLLSYGLASLLESLNLNDGWIEGQPHSIALKKLLDLQMEINSLREAYSSTL
jgi:hypothetical protein